MDRPDPPTFPELALGILLVGLLIALAIFSARDALAHRQARVVTERFQSDIEFARSEAVHRRGHIVMCRTTDYRRCRYSGVWSSDMIIFEDRNVDRDLNPDEPILRARQAELFEGLHLVGKRDRQIIGFEPDGTTTHELSSSFRLCAPSLEALRLLVVYGSGHASSKRAGLDTPSCGSD